MRDFFVCFGFFYSCSMNAFCPQIGQKNKAPEIFLGHPTIILA